MGRMLSWSDMKKTFPDEWVAIANFQGDTLCPYGEISGEVLVHNADETIFTRQLGQKNLKKSPIDIRYTGNILPDNPVGPILWQISDMNS